MTTSSITAVTLGTLSSISRGKSRQSRSAIGPTSVDQFEDWYKACLALVSRTRRRLRRGRRRQGQHRIDRLGVARRAKLLGDVLVAEETGDACQCLQMIGA